jgi:hypothetical protein
MVMYCHPLLLRETSQKKNDLFSFLSLPLCTYNTRWMPLQMRSVQKKDTQTGGSPCAKREKSRARSANSFFYIFAVAQNPVAAFLYTNFCSTLRGKKTFSKAANFFDNALKVYTDISQVRLSWTALIG